MNKKIVIILILVIIVIIALFFITKKDKIINEVTETTNLTEEIKGFSDVPQNFEIEKAIESDYFVIDGRENSDKIYNKDILDRFIENTSINSTNRKPDKIRIANYNYSGYPTIYEIEYKETGYILTIDASRNNIVPKSITTNNNIPSDIYSITIEEDPGINAAIIKFSVYSKIDNAEDLEQYKDIEITRFLLDDKIVNKNKI